MWKVWPEKGSSGWKDSSGVGWTLMPSSSLVSSRPGKRPLIRVDLPEPSAPMIPIRRSAGVR
jgi:hypothetical protein